jgi:hypothetical protein
VASVHHPLVSESYEKTTVCLHEHCTARALSHLTCLWFKRLVQKNNVRETRADMRQAICSPIMGVLPMVLGLFSGKVGSCPILVIQGS